VKAGHSERMKKHVSFYAFEMKGLRKILPAGFMDSKENK